MSQNPPPTPELLRKLLRYDPDTGLLFWRERSPGYFNATATRSAERTCNNWNARYANKEALIAINSEGYKQGYIFSVAHKAHRVIWALSMGVHPSDEIDHINHNRADNRLTNLRDVSRAGNAKNKKMASNNTSGHTGVYHATGGVKWVAIIGVKNKLRHLGTFEFITDAIEARKEAEIKYGYHPNHGRTQ